MCKFIYVYIYIYIYTYIYLQGHTVAPRAYSSASGTHIYISVYTNICIYMCKYMYIYIDVYILTMSHRRAARLLLL